MTGFPMRYQETIVQHLIEQRANARLVELNKLPAPNPPELVKPTKIRVLRPFFVKGRRAVPGDILSVEAFVARDMVALKKAELV